MAGDKVVYELVCKDDKTNGIKPVTLPKPKGFGARHTQVLLLFVSLSIAFSIKTQLSVSMVAMTSHEINDKNTCKEAVDLINDTQSENEDFNSTLCKSPKSEVLSKWNIYRMYDWNKATQEMIMFSFFVGYTSMMLPMGAIVQKFGGKKPILVALAVNGVISLITPWIPIYGDWLALCFCRFVQGSTQAAFFPGIHTIMANWAPLSERGRLCTYVYTGSQFGTIVTFQLSGVFAGSPSLGWPAIFWVCGALSLACCGVLAVYGAASPHDHAGITDDELAYIQDGGTADLVHKRRRTPWKSILTSSAVWGMVATHAGSSSGYLVLLTQIPTYMNFVLGVEIKKNGLYSSLPYIAMYLNAIMFGYLADYAVNKKILSVANIRRVANTLGMAVAGGFLVLFSFITSPAPAVIVLIVCLSFHSAIHVGYHINQIDLSPNFAGPIMALGNMIASLTSLLVPVVVANIVQDDMGNQRRWQIVFMMYAGFQILTNVVFVIFVKGTVQEWNSYGEDIEAEDGDTEVKLFKNCINQTNDNDAKNQ